MKHLFAILLLAVALSILVTACSEEVQSATLRVEMDKGARTMSPEQDDMEIYGYRVIPVGPGGTEGAPRYTYYSYINLDGLSVGEWTIKVYGFSKDRKDLAYGEKTVSLTSGKNTVQIEVKSLVGEGNFNAVLEWDSAYFVGVYGVDTTLTNQDGENIPIVASTPEGGRSTIVLDHVPAGSYVLQCFLVDKEGTRLSGFTEAVRITNGVTTEGKVKFTSLSDIPSDKADVVFSNMTSVPVEVKIQGIESLVEAKKTFSANISVLTPNISTNDLETLWYLDGEYLGRGTTLTVPDGVEVGIHRLDALVSTSDKGSVGSSSVRFQAAVSSSPGAPYQRNILQNGSDWKLGAGTIAKFLPDNRLIIASNTYGTVQLVDISGTTPVLVKEFLYDDLGLTGEVADFASYGTEDDTYFSVIFLCNTTSTPKAVNIICSRNQMTYNDLAKGFDSSGGSNPATQFVSIIPGDGIFLATIQSSDKARMGYVCFNINPAHGEMVNRKDWFILNPQLEYGFSGFKNSFALSDTGYIIVTSGQRAKVIRSVMQSGGKTSLEEHLMWQSWEDYMKWYNAGKTKAEFNDGQDCGFLTSDAQYAYIFSTEGIYYYKDCTDTSDEYTQYAFQSLEGRDIGDVRMCPDTAFGYMIDNSDHRLYTMNVVNDVQSGGKILQEGDYIALPEKKQDHIEISPGGNFLAVYSKGDADSLTIVKAAR